MTNPSQLSKPEGGVCPVDHNAREAWLHRARQQQTERSFSQHNNLIPAKRDEPAQSWTGFLSSYIPLFASSSSSSSSSAQVQTTQASPATTHSHQRSATPPPFLAIEREVSTIPRTPLHAAALQPPTSTPAGAMAASHGPPANRERDTGADPATGNWIYPSEKMFFEAMRRKGHDAREADMRVVVPIHNAVNERAWAEIREWERPYIEGTPCATPRLHSFSGDSTRLSPKARVNTLLGYQAPFDRHDWVVDRCGTQIEYLIDFYAGRDASDNGKPSFYLDVRPKLNSWEGLKMRTLRAIGVR